MTDHMSDGYLEVISLIERLHRQVLEVIKMELDRLGLQDINNVQALMLFNIGGSEISVGELMSRGYYLGSNVSYNVKKMIENGYLSHERSVHDRRSIRVRLTRKGRAPAWLCQASLKSAKNGHGIGSSQPGRGSPS